jgi:Flp pilus assembly protein TadG
MLNQESASTWLSQRRANQRQRAQTLVFFALSLSALVLLCGFAIDSGLMYLAKARISRAADGAALAAVGNFYQSSDPATNRADVAKIIRNFAAANYTDLATVNPTSTETMVSSTTYSYNFFDPTAPAQDPNGAYRKFVKVILTTGTGGQITSAQCTVRSPVHTYFIGIFSHFTDLKVSSGAVATRNPRMIMVVVDRSGSMLIPPATGNPGCVGLPAAVVTFLNFFDTSADYIGLVSFGSNARLEMPLTTNFLYAATNDLYEAYDIVTNTYSYNGSQSWYVPGADPEYNQPNYLTQGVRRFRFGGQTAADEGIRLALEQMMANPGWANPDVVKYMVIFTDGAWNTTRTLVAAPGYTNIVTGPTLLETVAGTNSLVTASDLSTITNAIYAFTQVPALRPWVDYWDSLGTNTYLTKDHQNDIIQSMATNSTDIGYEGNNYLSAGLVGAPHTYTTNTYLASVLGIPVYSVNLNVWLPPGSVDYVYRFTNGFGVSPNTLETQVSDLTNPQKTVNITLGLGDSNILVVPGYMIDGIIYDGLDLGYSVESSNPSTAVSMRGDNYVVPWMWPDADAPTIVGSSDIGTGQANMPAPLTDATLDAANPTWRGGSHSGSYGTDAENKANLGTPNGSTGSFERSLIFRNYLNLLSGFYVFRPDDPLGTGIEPLTGSNRPLNYPGAYYPSAAFYWPFDMVGLDQYPTFSLTDDHTTDPSPNGRARAIAWSINMLSTNAAPEWSGELFYQGKNAALSTTTSASTLMTSKAEWQTGIPGWVTGAFDHAGITETDTAHNTTNLSTAVVWRPTAFNGSGSSGNKIGTSAAACSPSDSANYTGGYVMDGSGNIWRNAMCWSGRPTHYYDFSRSTWTAIGTNHVKNLQFLPLGNWKASEYCWHARAAGVTVYTIGYGNAVTDTEEAFLATLANATNTTAGGGSNFLPQNYNTAQPIGQQFYATNSSQIGVDFSNVATAINAALTQ